jgi:hypothetical protein
MTLFRLVDFKKLNKTLVVVRQYQSRTGGLLFREQDIIIIIIIMVAVVV